MGARYGQKLRRVLKWLYSDALQFNIYDVLITLKFNYSRGNPSLQSQ